MRANIAEEGLYQNVKSDSLRLKLYMTKKIESII